MYSVGILFPPGINSTATLRECVVLFVKLVISVKALSTDDTCAVWHVVTEIESKHSRMNVFLFLFLVYNVHCDDAALFGGALIYQLSQHICGGNDSSDFK